MSVLGLFKKMSKLIVNIDQQRPEREHSDLVVSVSNY